MKKLIVALLMFSAMTISAKEIPLTQTITLYVPLKEFSVIEFPFEIKDKRFTPFISMVKKGDILASLKEEIEVPKMGEAERTSSKKGRKGKKNVKKKKPSPINVETGKNNLQIYPKKVGHTEVIVWGHKYPVIIKLVVDNELGIKHYRFIDYDQQRDIAAKFESEPHVRVLEKLTVALFDEKPPKGYKNESFYSEYIEEQKKFVLVQTFFGKRYVGEEWRVTNVGKGSETIHPHQYLDHGVYSVTPENNILNEGETTRMFLVRGYSAEEKGQ